MRADHLDDRRLSKETRRTIVAVRRRGARLDRLLDMWGTALAATAVLSAVAVALA
ncbi:MAG: hypothetical protein ACE37J_11855 [Pikeienuella sp.]|uniref:hypothetical protein n=1 Tax=Pikeienuella sp. TaxID=2831957 RepID=UPI003918CD3E